jgi:glycosyltransferase involved in cell wall biosynthesis
VSRVIYLSKARLPTEKAHGFQIMKMCEGMAALGHDVELLHPWRRQSDSALAETDAFSYYGVSPTFRVRTLANWDVIRLERHVPGLPFRALFKAHEFAWARVAARRAAAANPDLVYTRDAWSAYWSARFARACAFEAHLPPTGARARAVRRFSRRPSTRAVFALTNHTAGHLEAAGVPRQKLQVLPHAVDVAAFANAPQKGEARQLLGLPPQRPIIGYIGRFHTMGKEKGVLDLIRAMAAVELRQIDPLLLCVGGPMDPVSGYMDFATSIGVPGSAIRFADRVPNPDVPTWLAALDVAVIPYPAAERYPAASPLKLLEYMAAGLPIVATDLPALQEVIDDGENGLLVPPGDPESLARALTRLLEDPATARTLGDRARRHAARHTWRQRAEHALTTLSS